MLYCCLNSHSSASVSCINEYIQDVKCKFVNVLSGPKDWTPCYISLSLGFTFLLAQSRQCYVDVSVHILSLTIHVIGQLYISRPVSLVVPPVYMRDYAAVFNITQICTLSGKLPYINIELVVGSHTDSR